MLMRDYYVQFTTVQTSPVKGEPDGGSPCCRRPTCMVVFVALEDVGYFTMSWPSC